MAVTNLLAFTSYFPDSAIASLVLEGTGINPSLTDANEVSSAWGMLEKAKSSDYSQGRTSESLSSSARKRLVDDAKAIFKKNNVIYIEHLTAHINGVKW